MTIGIGTDYVDVQELRSSAEKQPEIYINRIFSPNELSYAKLQSDPIQCLAGKLAAKEACMKALGTGWTDDVDWLHVEVVNNEESGRPLLLLREGAEKLASALGVTRMFVTISHTSVAAIATVLLES
jgi:holo-[acyl-carrier protein] synthase